MNWIFNLKRNLISWGYSIAIHLSVCSGFLLLSFTIAYVVFLWILFPIIFHTFFSKKAVYNSQYIEKTVKPSMSSHSKPHTTPHMIPYTRLLKCFVLISLCCKTKHLRSLVWGIVQGFERIEKANIILVQHIKKLHSRFLLS